MPFTDVLSSAVISEKTSNILYRERTFLPDVLCLFSFGADYTGAEQLCQAAVAQFMAHSTKIGKRGAIHWWQPVVKHECLGSFAVLTECIRLCRKNFKNYNI